MSQSESYNVDHGEERGRIEYRSNQANVQIDYTRVEIQANKIHLFSGSYYQASVDTEDTQLFYGNEGVNLSVEVPAEMIEEIQTQVIET